LVKDGSLNDSLPICGLCLQGKMTKAPFGKDEKNLMNYWD